jgi:hypothetical protein
MNIILLEESEKRPSLNGETYFLVKSEVKLDEIEDFLDSATNEQTVFFPTNFTLLILMMIPELMLKFGEVNLILLSINICMVIIIGHPIGLIKALNFFPHIY